MSLIGQSWELMSELAKRTPWGEIALQPLINDIANVGPEFVRFLRNGGRVIVGPNPILNFNTAPFIPDGWEIRESDQIKSRVKGIVVNQQKCHSFYVSKSVTFRRQDWLKVR